ncbi:MAG: hypothetical protein LBU67_01895 [Oscillospiraceae bacterium]|jgi:mannose-1-phosphate guanylyltransferase/phosphomannomutase|nr:hypothetical protein [Oscillospiraceae bacterium]
MGIEAIIMAGGEGARLRPLTCGLPKPMVPVLDRPVMAYTLQLLVRHGIRQAGATLCYLPDCIRQHFGDGAAFGVDMRYWVEDHPVGTAGGIRQAMADLADPFFVLSGDGLTDCDLTAALDFHRRSGAAATLVMQKVPVPLEYGVVVTDDQGRVQRFVEKPGWGQVCSDTVNTGIYILQRDVLRQVPADRAFDFGRDLFPLLVQRGAPVYGWVTDGYWCDIGSQEAYLQAHADLLAGRVALDTGLAPDPEGRRVAPDAQVHGDARLEGLCWVGAGARVESGAHIGPQAVIGAGARVGREASVKRAVLWPGAQAGDRCQVRGAVLCGGARAQDASRLFEGSALGAESALGPGAELSPGARVWPGKHVDGGLRLSANLVWGHAARWVVDEHGVQAHTPEQATLLGAAWAQAMGVKDLGLMMAPGPLAHAQYAAVSAGLMARGAGVTLLGTGTLPMLRRVQRLLCLPAGVYVHGAHIEFTGQLGIAPGRDLQRMLEALCIRQDFPAPFAGTLRAPCAVRDALAFYIGALTADADARALADCPPRAAIFVHDALQQAQAKALAEALHLRDARVVRNGPVEVASWETGFALDADGESLTVFDAQGIPDEGAQALLRYQALLAGGAEEVVAPVHAPHGLESLAAEAGATVRRVGVAREAVMRALLDATPAQRQTRLWQLDVQFDGLCAMVALMGLLAQRRTTLRGLLQGQPAAYRIRRDVACAPEASGRILRALAQDARDADITDGLGIAHEGGWALLLPEKGRLRVLGEARDAEFAQALCDRYVGRIRQLAQETEAAPAEKRSPPDVQCMPQG